MPIRIQTQAIAIAPSIENAPHSRDTLDPRIVQGVDAGLVGETSALQRPTEIRDAASGSVLRL